MKIGFHPVIDNPVRMGYAPGWSCVADLTERLTDLEHAVGKGSVVRARWEPYFAECPSFRWAGAFEWARGQLQNPSELAVAIALFPGEPELLTTRIGHANWQILRTKSEPSRITRKLVVEEAIGVWESHATEWLEKIVATCATLGVETSVERLHQQVLYALQPLMKDLPDDDDGVSRPDGQPGPRRSHGYDSDLLHLDGWTPDPGLVILPVDGRPYSLRREILRLDHGKVALLRARKSARSVTWDKVIRVHLSDGAVTFEIVGEPPLAVAGYKHPEDVFKIVHECFKAAIERALQAVAAQMTRPKP
ncbi:hypothetical protein LBMAG56_23290 [Verrucomicrobiota bacterium]|nr:hypothetical protein LBMAG56_23290 [Verrucomicrobiota bacterium]